MGVKVSQKKAIKKNATEDAEIASKTWDVLASVGMASFAGIPLPPSMIKSLRKAADKFIIGATEYGMTFLEGAIAKNKALANGKIEVLTGSAKAVAKKISEDEQILSRAMNVFAADLVEKQRNKESVFAIAAKELKEGVSFVDTGRVVDDDWLGEFARLAAARSNTDVQLLLGKILAGEIREPGSFSPLTLQILMTLTPSVAKTFEKLCNVAIGWKSDEGSTLAFFWHEMYPDFMEVGAEELEINYGEMLVLQNYGLVLNNLEATVNAGTVEELHIEIGERKVTLRSEIKSKQIKLEQVAPLSLSGAELRKVIALAVPQGFYEKQLENFKKIGCVVVEG